MTKKIWQISSQKTDPLIEKFTVGDDHTLDQKLLPYDIKASLVHAEMLYRIKILNKVEFEKIKKGLKEILKKWEEGSFEIKLEQEDGHTAIEQFLSDNYGEVGKKIHTGRSRNDQSLVMIRLFMKEKLKKIETDLNLLIKTFNKKINKTKKIPMPGYTHMQRAMPTNVGVWLGSFLDGLKDFKKTLKATLDIIDQNPLGSASGFGINNFKNDREFTTKKLGFKKTQKNPMYCGLSRGYFENIVLQNLSQAMILSGRFANDLLLFTTSEFDFLFLPNSFTTGSSIMPQKRNYDLIEIMRGNVKVFLSYQGQIQNIISTLGSGYQRDLQLTKKPLIEGVELCEKTLKILNQIVNHLEFKEDKLKQAMLLDLYLTEEVYDLVNNGMSFRDAYVNVKKKNSSI